MTKVELFDPTSFNCPFCGLNVAFGLIMAGPPGTVGAEAVMHDTPECPHFMAQQDPVNFLQIALNELKKRKNNEQKKS